jgi:hypothetical protein
MKTLLTLFILFISSLTFAQKLVVTPIGLRNESDNEKTYVVLDIENKKAAELYTNALKYINKNYKNPEKVIIGKVENESLKFQTFVGSFMVVKNSIVKIPIDAEYSILLDFKDNKVKFEIQGLDMYYSPDGSKTRVLFEGTGIGAYYIYNKKGELKREETKTDIESYFNNEILKIVQFLSGKANEKADF